MDAELEQIRHYLFDQRGTDAHLLLEWIEENTTDEQVRAFVSQLFLNYEEV